MHGITEKRVALVGPSSSVALGEGCSLGEFVFIRRVLASTLGVPTPLRDLKFRLYVVSGRRLLIWCVVALVR